MERAKKIMIIVGIVLAIAVVIAMIIWPVVFDILAAVVVVIAMIAGALSGKGGGTAEVPPAGKPRTNMISCRKCGYFGAGSGFCTRCGSNWVEKIEW